MTDIQIPADTVGCFVPHNLDAPLRGSATGPLAGRTFAVKDLFDIAGRKTGNGNPAFYAWTKPAAATAPVVQKMLDAGASCIGVTVCDEFFYSLSGANAHYGTPKNLRAPGCLPGGSSSGSAAAVAAGLCDIALGSDTGGSVRVPAAFCGIYGIRPTHGRVDLTGGREMAPSYDVGGWFADDAEVFRSVGPVLLDGAGITAAPTRLLLAEDAFARAAPAVAEALHALLAAAAAVLPVPESVTVAAEGLDAWREAFRILQADEVRQTNVPWVEAHAAPLGPGIRERFAMAAAMTPEEVAQAQPVRERARERLHALVPPGTLLCLPTAPVTAPPVDVSGETLEFFRANTMALTCISGHSGLPQVTLPAAEADGCPVGLSFIGWAGGDEALLDLAVALQPFCLR